MSFSSLHRVIVDVAVVVPVVGLFFSEPPCAAPSPLRGLALAVAPPTAGPLLDARFAREHEQHDFSFIIRKF